MGVEIVGIHTFWTVENVDQLAIHVVRGMYGIVPTVVVIHGLVTPVMDVVIGSDYFVRVVVEPVMDVSHVLKVGTVVPRHVTGVPSGNIVAVSIVETVRFRDHVVENVIGFGQIVNI